jgi:hypothetical protein
VRQQEDRDEEGDGRGDVAHRAHGRAGPDRPEQHEQGGAGHRHEPRRQPPDAHGGGQGGEQRDRRQRERRRVHHGQMRVNR